MRKACIVILLLFVFCQVWADEKMPSVNLEDLTWLEAEQILDNYEVVLIALGARTKEHGPHLLLKNDFIMAEYLKDRVIKEVPVAILPTLQYGYYPAFLEYPGSVSLKAETFKNVVIDICMSMQGYGMKKFYILNTGVSTLRPLEQAAEELKRKNVILRYFNILEADKKIPSGYLKQAGGTHADEGETSMMLYISPDTVDMSKAVKDYDSRPNRRGLTRDPEGSGHYSPTGIWGDPTLATLEKGEIIVETTVKEIIKEVQDLIDLKIE
jgi:creatinine amidohydrolase